MKRKISAILLVIVIALLALASCAECKHPLSEEWDSDKNGHWHPTECEHGEFRGETESHVDVNEDGTCDAANLYKTTGAATAQTQAIKHLIASGRFEFLPDQLKETAKLRLENPQASLDELAGLHEGNISKSGVSHRLAKIVDFDKK